MLGRALQIRPLPSVGFNTGALLFFPLNPMQFFKRNLLYPVRKKDYDPKNFDRAFAAYKEHLLSIKKNLPKSAWELASLSFHDARVVSVTQPSKREVVISIDGQAYLLFEERCLKERSIALTFSGVKKFWVPTTIVGDAWLYEEMALSDVAAFDYQVLLSTDEVRIQADEVKIVTTGEIRVRG